MKPLINALFQNFRIYTGAQFGVDTEVSPLLAAKLLDFRVVSPNNEWSHKSELSCDIAAIDRYSNDDELITWLEFLEYNFDIVYVHGLDSYENNYRVLKHFFRRRTKFVVTGPNVKTNAGSQGYQKRRILLDKEYTLYYLDVIDEELEKLTETSAIEEIIV